MKLKTLKDFEVRYVDDLTGMRYEVIKKSELKAEVIKWVKECPHRKCKWPHLPEIPHKCSICLMMIDFHNITEEDLK